MLFLPWAPSTHPFLPTIHRSSPSVSMDINDQPIEGKETYDDDLERRVNAPRTSIFAGRIITVLLCMCITDIGQVRTVGCKHHRPLLKVRRRSLSNEFLEFLDLP